MANHKIIYAGKFEYCATWADWPRCTRSEAIAYAMQAARNDAARYGDKVCELVRIDGQMVTARENIEARKL